MTVLDAQASDPVRMGWMQGSPPPPERCVRWADMSMYTFPQLRWAMAHYQQLRPSRRVSRGEGPVSPWRDAAHSGLDDLRFHTLPTAQSPSRVMTWGQSLLENYTDAMVVLHRGRCIDERYLGVMDAHRLHMGMSITKSFTGLLAAQLAHEGELDVHRPVTHYLPELAQSAYATATVDQVMDMRIGVRYSENYADPEADIWRHARAGGVFPPRPGDPAPQGFRAFLCGLPPEGEHGKGFAYKTVNTDVLGWVMHRITGSDVGTLLQNRIWQALGAEHDAAMGVDDWGTDFAGGGLNCTVRDLARFGEMMRCAGHSHDRQVVAEPVVADIAGGGDQEAFQAGGYATLTNWSYRRMWWVSHNDHGAYMARGIHGQSLYIDPRAELVIVRFGSHPVAGNVFNDPVTLPAFHALAQALMA